MHTGQCPKECDRTNDHIEIQVARSPFREPWEVTTPRTWDASLRLSADVLGRTYLWYRKPQLSYLDFTDERNGDPIGKHQVAGYYVQDDCIRQTTVRGAGKRTNQRSGLSTLVTAWTANLAQHDPAPPVSVLSQTGSGTAVPSLRGDAAGRTATRDVRGRGPRHVAADTGNARVPSPTSLTFLTLLCDFTTDLVSTQTRYRFRFSILQSQSAKNTTQTPSTRSMFLTLNFSHFCTASSQVEDFSSFSLHIVFMYSIL